MYHPHPQHFEMDIQALIQNFIACLPEPKRSEMQQLHMLIIQALPNCKWWFDDGKNSDSKTINNPTIGYGHRLIKYANGKTKEFFQIGLSANATGISVFILGIKDKTYLNKMYGKRLGKAKITGYCIRFNQLKDINIAILEEAIRDGFYLSGEN